jgi:hypothetical protein
MLSVWDGFQRTCAGVSRRQLLQVGAATAAGLSLPDLFGARPAGAAEAPADNGKSCIFIFLWGGPPHHETFDPKPDAPSDVRGPWGAIPTRTDGLQFCEHLPELAKNSRLFTVIRNMSHSVDAHPDAGAYALTGRIASPTLRYPNMGATVAKFAGPRGALPAFVRSSPDLFDLLAPPKGQDGGFLGNGYAPFAVNDPTLPMSQIASFSPPKDVLLGRVERRRSLLQQLDDVSRGIESRDTLTADAAYERAFALVTSPTAKRAFDLGEEPDSVRDRYGRNKLGTTSFGQSCLMARRLVQAGVRFVQVNWSYDSHYPGWDFHGGGKERIVVLKDDHLPQLDGTVSTLLTDLQDRGMLEKTLVVMVGEFGRTPRINGGAGRDHWPYVYSALVAGGGVPGGRVLGASDAMGAYPDGSGVTPEDLASSIYRILGLDVTIALREAQIVRDSTGIPRLLDA